MSQQPAMEPQSYEAELASNEALVAAQHLKVHFPITAGLFQRTVGVLHLHHPLELVYGDDLEQLPVAGVPVSHDGIDALHVAHSVLPAVDAAESDGTVILLPKKRSHKR